MAGSCRRTVQETAGLLPGGFGQVLSTPSRVVGTGVVGEVKGIDLMGVGVAGRGAGKRGEGRKGTEENS